MQRELHFITEDVALSGALWASGGNLRVAHSLKPTVDIRFHSSKSGFEWGTGCVESKARQVLAGLALIHKSEITNHQ